MLQSSMNMSYENYDPSFPDQPVVDLYLPVWASLPAFRSKPAFIWVEDGSNDAAHMGAGAAITYGQLNESVHSISAHLRLSLQRGDTVLILCSPGLKLVEIIFGCQRAGLLSIPILPPHPSFTSKNYHHLVRVLSQTKPKAAIANHDYICRVRRYISSSPNNHKLAELLKNLQWISTSDTRQSSIGPTSTSNTGSFSYEGCKPNEMYLIQYTSGATGIPKPVLVTTGSAAHNVRLARKSYELHPSSVIVSWLPQYHDCGLQFLLLTVVSGATCVLTSPAAFVKRPRLWLELISVYEATCSPVPSFALPLVVKRGGVDDKALPISLWSLKNLIIINEPIYRASVDEFVGMFEPFGLSPSCISPSYGLAENCTFVSTSWRSNSNRNSTLANNLPLPSYNRLLPSARLDSEEQEEEEEIDIVVVNEETREPVEDGTEGEIWVSSPSNCSGYLHYPSLTRDIFQCRLANTASRCFVRTGDRGVVRGEERYLYVTGRCADVIRLPNGQETVHPHYIETSAQNSCPRFLRGGCVAAFETSGALALVAEMKRGEKDSGVLREICEEIKRSVAREEGLEVGWVVLVKSGSVPKTTSGKVQRWAAKDKLVRGEMSVVMEIKFKRNNNNNNNANGISQLSRVVVEESREGRGKEKRSVVQANYRRERMFAPLASNPTSSSLRSFL